MVLFENKGNKILQTILQTTDKYQLGYKNDKLLTTKVTRLFYYLIIKSLSGGGSRIRTGDPMLAKHVSLISNKIIFNNLQA